VPELSFAVRARPTGQCVLDVSGDLDLRTDPSADALSVASDPAR
jgi:hypothetical protein